MSRTDAGTHSSAQQVSANASSEVDQKPVQDRKVSYAAVQNIAAQYSRAQRLFAVFYGVLCHALFALAIGLMGYEVFWGFSRPIFDLGFGANIGRWFNLLLLLQFPLFHSLFLTALGRRWMASMLPFGLGKDLATTTFAVLASVQLMVVFLFWVPTQTIWFAPHGALLVAMSLLFAASWLLLGKAIYDASLALHSGFLGWGAVARGQAPRFAPPAARGTYRLIRQPIYLAFALILFTGPVWTPDHLWFAGIWGLYCFAGPLLKERRLRKWHGDAYAQYQKTVPYMVPRLVRR